MPGFKCPNCNKHSNKFIHKCPDCGYAVGMGKEISIDDMKNVTNKKELREQKQRLRNKFIGGRNKGIK